MTSAQRMKKRAVILAALVVSGLANLPGASLPSTRSAAAVPSVPACTKGNANATDASAMKSLDKLALRFEEVRDGSNDNGSVSDERANSVAVDASGNVLVAGDSESFDFPTTPGAFQAVGPYGYKALSLGSAYRESSTLRLTARNCLFMGRALTPLP